MRVSLKDGAEGVARTRTSLRSTDFKSFVNRFAGFQ
jgi:hypothetical protein